MSKSGPLHTERVGHSLTSWPCAAGVGERPIFIIGSERSAGHGEICAVPALNRPVPRQNL
jgi:hypothetical protein